MTFTYWFRDDDTGEEFFVELDHACYKEARAIAKEYFEAPKFLGTVSEEEAEMMGYDTY